MPVKTRMLVEKGSNAGFPTRAGSSHQTAVKGLEDFSILIAKHFIEAAQTTILNKR